ncbi:hypothetical protein HK104_009577 [Borealophlyctis nickersoniae]|nr:hypothetical protein HK104_009577 [Borealophlyctis nickersoniae]
MSSSQSQSLASDKAKKPVKRRLLSTSKTERKKRVKSAKVTPEETPLVPDEQVVTSVDEAPSPIEEKKPTRRGGRKGGKKVKDPNAPKRPASAYPSDEVTANPVPTFAVPIWRGGSRNEVSGYADIPTGSPARLTRPIRALSFDDVAKVHSLTKSPSLRAIFENEARRPVQAEQELPDENESDVDGVYSLED